VARTLAKTKAFEQSCRDRKRIEMLFAHFKHESGTTPRSSVNRPTKGGRIRPDVTRGA
jgi:hypothetical protein